MEVSQTQKLVSVLGRRAAILLLLVLSASQFAALAVTPAHAAWNNFHANPTSITVKAGGTATYMLTISYYRCWFVCQGVFMWTDGPLPPNLFSNLPPYMETPASCMWVWWGGECDVPFHVYTNPNTAAGSYNIAIWANDQSGLNPPTVIVAQLTVT